jgi:WD40 repeat protein
MTDGKNFCVGVFSSHKDVVWQLVYHPIDDMLLSVSSDGSVKLWKSFDFLYGRGSTGEGVSSNQYFDSIE